MNLPPANYRSALNIIPEGKLQADRALSTVRVERIRKIKSIAEGNKISRGWKKKYQVAGYGFMGLSSIYIVLAWNFMPPFLPGFPRRLFWPLVFLLTIFLTKKILTQRTRWVQSLAILSGLRFIASSVLILKGDYLPIVPYFLPCFILTFYLLGRAGWNWP